MDSSPEDSEVGTCEEECGGDEKNHGEAQIDEENRTISFFAHIEEDSASSLIAAVRFLDESEGDINILLFSPGGGEIAGYAIYDAIRMSTNPVNIIGLGEVGSIAALILQAGDRRLLSENCSFMIHNGSIVLGAGSMNTPEAMALGKQTGLRNARYHRLLSEHSGNSIKAVADWCRDESYFTAQEAVRAGFADGILKSNRKKRKTRHARR